MASLATTQDDKGVFQQPASGSARGQQRVRVIADADDQAGDASALGPIAGKHRQEVAGAAASGLKLIGRDCLGEQVASEALGYELVVALGLSAAWLCVTREKLAGLGHGLLEAHLCALRHELHDQPSSAGLGRVAG